MEDSLVGMLRECAHGLDYVIQNHRADLSQHDVVRLERIVSRTMRALNDIPHHDSASVLDLARQATLETNYILSARIANGQCSLAMSSGSDFFHEIFGSDWDDIAEQLKRHFPHIHERMC